MKEFFAYLLIVSGLLAMLTTLCLGLFAGDGSWAPIGGLGLVAAVFGAAILGEK